MRGNEFREKKDKGKRKKDIENGDKNWAVKGNKILSNLKS